MKNINYDLVKLLHSMMDIVWRIENHYAKDAEEAKCHSIGALKQILEQEKKHIEMISKEIKMRMDAGIFE